MGSYAEQQQRLQTCQHQVISLHTLSEEYKTYVLFHDEITEPNNFGGVDHQEKLLLQCKVNSSCSTAPVLGSAPDDPLVRAKP